MSAISPQGQNKEEFKEYLDKTGVLEFINTNVSQNKKNKEFKEFLEFLNKAGVLEFLDSVLIKLYKEPHKPKNAREYIKNNIGGDKADKDDIAKLSYDNNELKKRIEELEKTEAELTEKLMGAADATANNTVTTAAIVDAAEVSATALQEPPNIDSFCNELVETLLSLLPPRDLISAVLVCKRWNTIGEGPHLWSGVDLVVSNLAHMPEILGLSRLTKLKQLTLKNISKEMLEAIENHEGLETLKLLRCNLSEINSDLLARVLTKMEEVRLEETDPNRDQWNAFFNSMSDDTKLKKLEIIDLFLTKVNPLSLAEAVGKLEMFELDGFGCLTSEQSKALFKQLAIKSKLKSLKMTGVRLSSVDEPFLVTVLSQLEEAALCYTNFNARQCTAIIGLVAAGNSKLKVLLLSGNNLKYVNPPDIAKAVGNMEIVDLDCTQLTNEQCKEIFKYAQGDSNLKSLNIGSPSSSKYNDLRSVEPASLAKTVRKLEIVDLTWSHLTNEQCKEIFKYAQGDSNLKVLHIGGNDLRSVEPANLAKTVSKMERCSLLDSKLTTLQLEAIFKQLNEDCKLKELDMQVVILSEVGGDGLSKAIANLVKVDLSYTQLTTQQFEALFMEIKSGRKLKILKLRGTDLRSVKIDSLVGALGCLEVVHLSRDSLTPEQWDAVKSDVCRAKVIM